MTRARIGKRKKVIVYASRKKAGPNTVLLFIAGGVIIYYLYSKTSSAQTTTVTPITDPTANTGLPTTANGQPIIPGGDVINTNPGGYNSQIPGYHSTTTPVITPVAATGRSPQGQQYYDGLLQQISDPVYKAAFAKMTDLELYYAWWYWSNYLSKNIMLLKATRLLPTGQWDNSNPGNAELYNAVQSIHSKYGIF